ncbi:hypothetical protein [Roseibacillus ishigakijimensis]|uniref:Uncharacterized protein n=1 Tax=Roseibacillus ishigakijimensis TaxID=454146 RepID=A0A934RRM0_9BACT|nr:hypothetical protein [Roseibacillus ishigakijimensis]MBK1832980.1 hypothetical protein [Roseibacillus ishigakijimensis]
MDKNSKKGDKPELRVVDEDKVTRLGSTGSPVPAPPRKKAQFKRSNEEGALQREIAREDEDPLAEAPDELEDVLLTDTPAAPLRIPPAFIALAVIAFLALLGAGVFLALGGRDSTSRYQSQESARERIQFTEQEKEEARRLVADLGAALEKYTSARTIEEKLAVSRHPERVEPLMRDYYAQQEFKVREGALLKEQYTLPIEFSTFVVLTASFDDGSSGVFLAEIDNDLQVRIDWESDVCYQPVDISEYIAQRPTEPVTLRVFVTPDNFYVYEFKDSEKYKSLQLTFRDSDEYLFGYVELGSKVSRQLSLFLGSAARASQIIKPEPALLQVRFLPGGDSERGVLIEKFIAPRWAYIDEAPDAPGTEE